MSAAELVMLFSSGLALVTAAGLFISRRTYQNMLAGIALAFIGYMHFLMYLFYGEVTVSKMQFFNTHFFLIFAFGPLALLIVKTITHKKNDFVLSDLLHFVPALLVLVFIETRYLYFTADMKTAYARDINSGILSFDLRLIGTCAVISLTAYSALALYHLYMYILNSKNLPKSFYVLIIMNVINMGGVIVYFLPRSLIIQYPIQGMYVSIFFSLNTVYIFLYLQRYFILGQDKKTAIREERKDSRSFNINTEDVKTRLHMLLDEEKVFCDEDLSLTKLASLLDLTPHQLSYFLNSCYSQNFKTFINGYRLEEAKKMLVNEPERNILSVGFASGFNSSSSFHSIFKKVEGISPADFRKKNTAEK